MMMISKNIPDGGLTNIALAAARLEDDQEGAALLLRNLSASTPPISVLPIVSPLNDDFNDLGVHQEEHNEPVIIIPDLHFGAIDAPSLSTIISIINESDVLCGRGGETNHHKGNVRYRCLVKTWQPAYIAAKRREKPCIARLIVNKVRGANPPGRFLKKGPDGKWRDVGNGKAREKTSQALREGAPEMRALVGPIMIGHDGQEIRISLPHPIEFSDRSREISLSSNSCSDDSLSSPVTSDGENEQCKKYTRKKRKSIEIQNSKPVTSPEEEITEQGNTFATNGICNPPNTIPNAIEAQKTPRGPRIKMLKARMLNGGR